MLKTEFLETILSTSGAEARKYLNQTFCDYVFAYWSRGQKMLKSESLGPILSISGAKARKSFNAPEVDRASPRSIDLMTF